MHLTQQQVADKVFVTRQTISKWELGKSQPDLVSSTLLKNVLQLDDLYPDGAKNTKGEGHMKPTLSWKDLLFTLFFKVDNTARAVLTHLHQQPDGAFGLLRNRMV